MESASFLNAFQALPGPAATFLAKALERSNTRHEDEVFRRHLERYAAYAHAQAATCDLVLFGHIHLKLDNPQDSPRWIVLGDWKISGSYVRVKDGQAHHLSLDDPASP